MVVITGHLKILLPFAIRNPQQDYESTSKSAGEEKLTASFQIPSRYKVLSTSRYFHDEATAR